MPGVVNHMPRGLFLGARLFWFRGACNNANGILTFLSDWIEFSPTWTVCDDFIYFPLYHIGFAVRVDQQATDSTLSKGSR